MNIENVFKAYLECALWSFLDYNEDPLDKRSRSKVTKSCKEKMLSDVTAFCNNANIVALVDKSGLTDTQVGHDFWLTRNSHGAGFWDRNLGQVGEKLTGICKEFGIADLYVGKNGWIYHC